MKEFKYESGKIKEIKIELNGMTKTIKVESFFAVMKLKNDETAGKIIENYREKVRDQPNEASEYFCSKKGIIDKFISNIQQRNESYDYVQVFVPFDVNRKGILNQFSKKLYSGDNDYSNHFKKSKNKSVVNLNCDDAEQLFDYEKPTDLKEPLKSILLIDDTIDTGCTIEIFLKKLFGKELIGEDTEIKAVIIYNNYRENKNNFSLDDYKKLK